MRRWRKTVAKLVGVSVLLTGAVAGTQLAALLPAQAVTCSSPLIHDFGAFDWTDGSSKDVQGVRAPLKARTDGAICNESGHPDSSVSVWIAVQADGSQTDIVQIGFDRFYHNDVSTLCQFWAKSGGVAQEYNCGGLADDGWYWFQIHPWNNGTEYIIDDCGGSGGYQDPDCTAESSNQGVYTNPVGTISEEEYYGCDLHSFGANSDQEQAGRTDSKIQAEGTGLNWTTRTWSLISDVCETGADATVYNHHQDNSGEVMHWYDTRNAG